MVALRDDVALNPDRSGGGAVRAGLGERLLAARERAAIGLHPQQPPGPIADLAGHGATLATVSDCAIIERSACSVSSRQSTRRERLLVPRAARQPRRASWRGVLMVAVRGAAALRPVAPVVARRRCARPSSARHGTRQAVVHPGAVIRLPVRPAECHPRSGNCLRSTHREQEPVPEQAASMCGGWSSEVAEKRLRAPARPCRRAPRPSQRASHPVCVCFSAKPICSGSA